MSMDGFHFYQDTLSRVDGSLTTYVNDVASNVIVAITPVASTLLAIYVMLWGWSTLRGVISEPVTDGIGRIVRLSVIVAIALNVGRYNTYLADMLWRSPEVLAGFVASGHESGVTNTQYLDALFTQIYDLGDAYWQKGQGIASGGVGFPDVGLLIIALLVWVAGAVATGFSFFLIVIAKIALAILLGVGPIFILMTIFEPTRRFFDVWIGQALNYVFLVMLTSAAIKLVMSIIKAYLAAADQAGVLVDPAVNQALPPIVLSGMAFLVMMQLPSIASALGGGVAMGTLGAINWAYGKASGSMAAMRPTELRRALNKARSDVRIASGTAKAVGGAPLAVYRKVAGVRKNRVSRG